MTKAVFTFSERVFDLGRTPGEELKRGLRLRRFILYLFTGFYFVIFQRDYSVILSEFDIHTFSSLFGYYFILLYQRDQVADRQRVIGIYLAVLVRRDFEDRIGALLIYILPTDGHTVLHRRPDLVAAWDWNC